ncbi:hypothetical protein EGW08_022840 [Elysia chlorotica]|uniref:Uncharacterized protein n=1 Tax=Elysia chlorotica TaxID=188477 RepID=A0A3S0ZKB1_ELYCH|nr:hypothetical protein EGW08_022840 [Elysia chlorotica]
MNEFGHIPLPQYMKRDDEEFDTERYQTVYAKDLGSVAAPTAGLHFSEELMQKIKDKGVDTAYITLHVGSGTFKPVQVDDVDNHKMHSEVISVSEEVCDKIKHTKANGGRVIAIGTTSVRSLETAGISGEIAPYQGNTKADGIDKVIKHLGLDDYETYAFGDGNNDLEMFDRVDVAVAMGNATPELKDKARVHVGDLKITVSLRIANIIMPAMFLGIATPSAS